MLFVGEDERARLVAHLGPAAGWMIPKGVLGWSHEVSVVARDALNEHVRREAKIVMPDEQIPPAKMPLTHQATLKSPLVAVSSKLTQKLIESGIRVHTVGADRVTSSFYYIAEGGTEPPIRIEGDLVAAVGAMLGERADNAAIERVLDGLVDRLLRSLSKDRVTEIALELAAALPRAAADGTGTQDVDPEAFEKELSMLVGASEKYAPFLQEIATKIEGTNDRRVEIPLFGDARKISQGPFELTVGDSKVSLVTHERWIASGPFREPAAPAAAAAAKKAPASELPKPKAPEPAPVEAKVPAPAPTPKPGGSIPRQVAPPRPASTPLQQTKPTTPEPAKVEPAKVEPAKVEPPPEPAKVEPAKVEPAKAEPVKAEPPPEPAKVEPAKAEPVKVEPAKIEPAKAEPAKAEPMKAEPPPEPVKAEPPPEPVKAEPPPEPVKAAQPEPTPQPMAKAEPTPTTQPKVADASADSRLATTQRTKRKEKGFPWLVFLLLAAALFAGYRFWWARR
jgi:hypothetical protein